MLLMGLVGFTGYFYPLDFFQASVGCSIYRHPALQQTTSHGQNNRFQ